MASGRLDERKGEGGKKRAFVAGVVVVVVVVVGSCIRILGKGVHARHGITLAFYMRNR